MILKMMLATQMVVLPALAQSANRQTSDAIFTEPRQSAIKQMLLGIGDLIALEIVRPKLPSGTAIAEAQERLLAAAKAGTNGEMVSDDVILHNIHDAETDLAKARLVALNSLQDRGVIPRLIRYARVVGTSLIIVDLLGRAWVWGALEANPTWSPAVTMLNHLGQSISTENALPSR
jgi:hypothetical protein